MTGFQAAVLFLVFLINLAFVATSDDRDMRTICLVIAGLCVVAFVGLMLYPAQIAAFLHHLTSLSFK